MEINIHDVIVGPVISDRAYKLNQKLNQLVIRVHPQANKPQIKRAVEQLFSVKVDKVRTITRQGKQRMTPRRKKIVDAKRKKAIITLQRGYSLDLIGTGMGASDVQERQEG